jgi:hypothetical protein
MARIGIQTTKSTLFRGAQQEFNNVYYYESLDAVTVPAEGLIDEIVALEKSIHSNAVNFVRAACWQAGGTPAQNQMLFQKNLSGTGAAGQVSTMDRERAYLIQWDAGFNSRGQGVKLRKWFHTCGAFGAASTNPATGVMANTSEIPSADRTSIAGIANALDEVGNLESWSLTSKTGRNRTGSAKCHPYLEHHQLGENWR